MSQEVLHSNFVLSREERIDVLKICRVRFAHDDPFATANTSQP